MSINENIQGSQKDDDTNVPKGTTMPTHEDTIPAHEDTIPDKQVSDKFPKWDILPPHQFINPRVKRTY